MLSRKWGPKRNDACLFQSVFLCVAMCRTVQPTVSTYLCIPASMHCGNRRTPASCIHVFIYIYMHIMTHYDIYICISYTTTELHVRVPILTLVLILIQMLILSLYIQSHIHILRTMHTYVHVITHTHIINVHSTACRTLFMPQGFRSLCQQCMPTRLCEGMGQWHGTGRQGNNTLRYHCGFEGVNYMQSRFHTEEDFNHWIQAGKFRSRQPWDPIAGVCAVSFRFVLALPLKLVVVSIQVNDGPHQIHPYGCPRSASSHQIIT